MPTLTASLTPDPSSHLERSRGVLFAQWEELLRLRSKVIKTTDPDDIHDLRVASRRFRAALELFGPVVSAHPKTKLHSNVRKLTRMLGGLRNIDEALLFFRSRARSCNPADHVLCHMLADLRPRELKRIKKGLISFDQHNLDCMVRKMIAGLNADGMTGRNSTSLPAYFSDVSIRLYLPVQQLLTISTVPEQREHRHALRIAIKKLRYFFEIVAQVLERDYTLHLEQLKEYQSLLGRMNDLAEFEALLSGLELSREELEYVEATLKAEDALLLEKFNELMEQKPLSYTFLS